MLNTEFVFLLATASSIALLHTVTGPDHYLPFVVISKSRNWSLKKTILFTALCGAGHVGSSVVVGLLGISLGIAVEKLEIFEGVRGSIVTYLFTAFGLLYMVWGIRRAIRSKRHTHQHYHKAGGGHEHEHSHSGEHVHVHNTGSKAKITPWILFTIFIFGPCEPLIPIIMYPAAKHNYLGMLVVTAAFSIITISTMILLVTAASYGIRILPMRKIERYSHALAGGTILMCGLGMLFLGL